MSWFISLLALLLTASGVVSSATVLIPPAPPATVATATVASGPRTAPGYACPIAGASVTSMDLERLGTPPQSVWVCHYSDGSELGAYPR